MYKVVYVVLFLIISREICSQEAGVIFRRNEADSLFGPVEKFVELDIKTAKSFLKYDTKFIMFKIIDAKLVVLDEKRELIYGQIPELQINDTIIFHMYRTTIYSNLVEHQSTSESVYFEDRKDVFSVTYGSKTMERAVSCPPYCVDVLELCLLK